jgi:hypothetical protein
MRCGCHVRALGRNCGAGGFFQNIFSILQVWRVTGCIFRAQSRQRRVLDDRPPLQCVWRLSSETRGLRRAVQMRTPVNRRRSSEAVLVCGPFAPTPEVARDRTSWREGATSLSAPHASSWETVWTPGSIANTGVWQRQVCRGEVNSGARGQTVPQQPL